METFVFSVVFFALAMGVMAIGVMLSGRRLQGSCGGTGAEACACSMAERLACLRHERGSLDP